MIKELSRHGNVLIDEGSDNYRIRIGHEVKDGVKEPIWANGIAFSKDDLLDIRRCVDEVLEKKNG